MEQVRALHGPEGDKCWDATRCPRKRSHLRQRDRINQERSRQRQESAFEKLEIPIDESFTNLVFAVLVIYREPGTEAPIHAIGAQVWRGSEQIVLVEPIHCVGMVPTQMHGYIQKLLQALGDRYGIRKFASLERFDPDHCPIQPCPKSPKSLVTNLNKSVRA
jgi:hypothetical protein